MLYEHLICPKQKKEFHVPWSLFNNLIEALVEGVVYPLVWILTAVFSRYLILCAERNESGANLHPSFPWVPPPPPPPPNHSVSRTTQGLPCLFSVTFHRLRVTFCFVFTTTYTYLTSKGRYCLEIFVIENNHHNQVFVGNNTAIVFTRDIALLFGRTGNLSCVTLILTKRLFVCRVTKLNNVKLEISQG